MAGGDRGADWNGNATAQHVGERDLLAFPPEGGEFVHFVPAEAAPPATPRPPPSRRRLLALAVSLRGLPRRAAAAAATELDRGAAFLLAPVFLGAGIAWYFSLDAEPGLRPALVALALAALSFAARARPRLHLALLATLTIALGVLAAQVETWRAGTAMLGAEISTRLTGRVVQAEEMASGRVRLTLDVVETARPKLRYQPQRVRLSARRLPAGITAGATVSGFVRLLPPTGPVRPGGYDFSFQSYFEGIGASGFFLTDPKPVAAAEMPATARLSAAVENARQAVAARIRSSVGGPEGEIAAALIVGVRAGIPEEINEAMRRIGIYHIISISGLHMALVAGTIMVLLRGGLALLPDFASRRPVKKYAALAALCATGAYLLVSGVEVAAERSFIMLAVMLTAVLCDRVALTMRNLAISALVVMLVSPHEVMGPSFQMSFAATAALVAAFAAWSQHPAAGPGRAPPRRSAAGLAVHRVLAAASGTAAASLVAGLATTFYAVWHFQRVAPLSLFANLAVMPVVSLVVMPSAVLGALAMPFGADWPFLYLMGRGLAAMIAIADWISVRSPLDAVGLVSPRSVLLLTIALVVATMATTWLRLAALPLAVAGLLALPPGTLPHVLVSEDARLVAVPLGGGEIAVNRVRPNAFTLDNWRRALDAETVVGPERPSGADLRLLREAAADLPAGTPFLCSDGLCVARHASGALVAHAADMRAARPACAYAALIVIDDATAADPCGDPLVAVLTGRELARSGSAAVFFDPDSATAPAEIRFAVEADYRPWHAQRRFSREARGLAPFAR